MSQKANPVAIGGFVLGALAIAVAGVLFLGAGKLFESTTRYVIYFGGSVVGLDEGAPVLFRGVQVGRVAEIRAFYYTKTAEIQIPVYVDLVSNSVHTVGGDPENPADGPVAELVRRGLRAQLRAQSLVTGKLYVALDMNPDRPARLTGLDPRTPEIPSIPTVFEEAQAALGRLFQRLQTVDLERLGASLEGALASADALLSSAELKQTVAAVGDAAEALRELARNANGQIRPAREDLAQTSIQAREALAQAEKTLAVLERDLGRGSPINYQLLTTLQEISDAARSLRAVADALSAQPDSLIFGRRPEEE
ncbi:MAG: MlaD family protein [Myxococcota bacterium]